MFSTTHIDIVLAEAMCCVITTARFGNKDIPATYATIHSQAYFFMTLLSANTLKVLINFFLAIEAPSISGGQSDLVDEDTSP